jgi:hypothetical protein
MKFTFHAVHPVLLWFRVMVRTLFRGLLSCRSSTSCPIIRPCPALQGFDCGPCPLGYGEYRHASSSVADDAKNLFIELFPFSKPAAPTARPDLNMSIAHALRSLQQLACHYAHSCAVHTCLQHSHKIAGFLVEEIYCIAVLQNGIHLRG